MTTLFTTDNTTKNISELCSTSQTVDLQSVFDDLLRVANLPVRELVKKNRSLLVFPQKASIGGCIFEMSGDVNAANIATKNLMGFVGFGETQLMIKSRFAQKDTSDFFLHYLLQKAFALNLFDLKHATDDGEFDFLLYLLPYFLKKAFAQGVFSTYKRFEKNDSNVKGTVDIARHIRQNAIFSGKIAYTSRERSQDNFVTQLVRHAIEFVKTKPYGKAVLNFDNETMSIVRRLCELTPSYTKSKKDAVIAKNLTPINHPYFTAFSPLQQICLSLLLGRKVQKYGENERQIYGLLFDGAWLWEEYLATLLCRHGFSHPKNRGQSGGIKIFEDLSEKKIYPDFYNERCILDAKYKRFDDDDNKDLYQIVAYMHIMNRKFGCLIYPSDISKIDKFKLAGLGGVVAKCAFKVPQSATNFVQFCEAMQESEERFIGNFKQL